MTINGDPVRWLPVAFQFSRTAVSIGWVDFGTRAIADPFFHQTVKALRKASALERTTDLSALLMATEGLPVIVPAGVILHISRCGSTLLARALGTGHHVVTLNESRPIGTFLMPGTLARSPFPMEGRAAARKMILDSITTIYAQATYGSDTRLIIKCHAASMSQLSLLRTLWPNVPVIVLIRDPTEVAVSNLAKPGLWLRSRINPRPNAKRKLLRARPEAMTPACHCARGIGHFCAAARASLDARCRVIDYSNLDAAAIRCIADFFEVGLPDVASDVFQRALSTYSKDLTNSRIFQDDRQRKQREITDEVRDAVARWAQPEYDLLRRLEFR